MLSFFQVRVLQGRGEGRRVLAHGWPESLGGDGPGHPQDVVRLEACDRGHYTWLIQPRAVRFTRNSHFIVWKYKCRRNYYKFRTARHLKTQQIGVLKRRFLTIANVVYDRYEKGVRFSNAELPFFDFLRTSVPAPVKEVRPLQEGALRVLEARSFGVSDLSSKFR